MSKTKLVLPRNPGRLPDPNPELRAYHNSRYPVRPLLPREDIAREMRPPSRVHKFPDRHCNQYETGTCTAQSIKSFEICEPVTQSDRGIDSSPTAFDIYDWIVANDSFRQNDKDVDPNRTFGATTDDSMRAARYFNIIAEWRNAQSMQDILDWLAFKGPMIIALDWDDGFFRPDANGFVRPVGNIVGGHQFLCNGYDESAGIVKHLKCPNSWGDVWGVRGNFNLPLDVAEDFIFNRRGQAVATLEVPTVIPTPEPTHGYPYQQWLTVQEYRDNGLIRYVNSSYELHYLLGIKLNIVAQLGLTLALSVKGAADPIGPLENNLDLFNRLSPVGTLPEALDTVYMIQRIQARHHGGDWLS